MLEKVRFADRMLPHIPWTGSFQLEEHKPMVRSLMSQMGCFTLEKPSWVPSSWRGRGRWDLTWQLRIPSRCRRTCPSEVTKWARWRIKLTNP